MTDKPMTTDNRLHTSLHSLTDALPLAWREALDAPPVRHALTQVADYIDARVAAGATVYPATPYLALTTVAPADVRVVILGQDPYHGPGQAQGLAFSVPDDCRRPPSLRNIFKEIAREYPDTPTSTANDLSSWAAQGVLLLNTSLTVEDGQPASHAKRGWEVVTDALIADVARQPGARVFMLWGAHAQAKRALLAPRDDRLVLCANHPSPLSAMRPPVPFLGCGHFAQANAWLENHGRPPVDWASPHTGVARQATFGL
jgi:uracil-DNA glycosylase